MPPIAALPDDSPIARLAPWGILLAGLCALYVPTFVDLFNGLWTSDQNAHGPIVFGVAMWFLWFKSRLIAADTSTVLQPAPRAGAIAIAVGLIFYVLGRSQSVYLFEVGSMIPLLAGGVLLFFGGAVLRQLWFAFFFMFFMICQFF